MEAIKKQNFYTPNGWQGTNYDRNMTCKDIAANIRGYCKANFPLCKFSVTQDVYSINIAIMEAPQSIMFDNSEYSQINHYSIKDSERLTDYGKKVLSGICNYATTFNYDDSDAMIDYFDTNFYLNIAVGKWNKPFRVVPKNEIREVKQTETTNNADIKLVDYSEKAIAIIGNTKQIKDNLKTLGGRFNMHLSCGAGWIFPKSKAQELKQAFNL